MARRGTRASGLRTSEISERTCPPTTVVRTFGSQAIMSACRNGLSLSLSGRFAPFASVMVRYRTRMPFGHATSICFKGFENRMPTCCRGLCVVPRRIDPDEENLIRITIADQRRGPRCDQRLAERFAAHLHKVREKDTLGI